MTEADMVKNDVFLSPLMEKVIRWVNWISMIAAGLLVWGSVEWSPISRLRQEMEMVSTNPWQSRYWFVEQSISGLLLATVVGLVLSLFTRLYRWNYRRCQKKIKVDVARETTGAFITLMLIIGWGLGLVLGKIWLEAVADGLTWTTLTVLGLTGLMIEVVVLQVGQTLIFPFPSKEKLGWWLGLAAVGWLCWSALYG